VTAEGEKILSKSGVKVDSPIVVRIFSFIFCSVGYNAK
jgi:hypothetical protein